MKKEKLDELIAQCERAGLRPVYEDGECIGFNFGEETNPTNDKRNAHFCSGCDECRPNDKRECKCHMYMKDNDGFITFPDCPVHGKGGVNPAYAGHSPKAESGGWECTFNPDGGDECLCCRHWKATREQARQEGILAQPCGASVTENLRCHVSLVSCEHSQEQKDRAEAERLWPHICDLFSENGFNYLKTKKRKK